MFTKALTDDQEQWLYEQVVYRKKLRKRISELTNVKLAEKLNVHPNTIGNYIEVFGLEEK